jgi:hypothetical protein
MGDRKMGGKKMIGKKMVGKKVLLHAWSAFFGGKGELIG